VEFVGPKVGAELRRAGLKAFFIAFGLILIYVAVRFTWSFAPGTVIALIHDVLATAAIWILLGQQFDLEVLAALLAIAGYSLNDTIIIYDRIREMMHVHTTQDLPDVINRSVNQTLSRTLLTSGLTMITVLALLFLGGEVIFSFSAAMAIGIVIGSYSSIYIAAPIMLLLEQRREAREKTAPKKGKGGRARAKATA
jgi:preprotein translocase subunit SecF